MLQHIVLPEKKNEFSFYTKRGSYKKEIKF